MNDQPIQPLAWDGGAISYELEEHPLAALYSEVIRLGCDLAQCVDDGITRWRNDYWQEELAYTAFPPLRLICTDRHEQDDAAREEARELSGYPANIRDAAQGIFYGLRSAEQYQGYYRNLAEAIRERAFPNREALRECAKPEDGKPALYVISDRNVYAMAAATEAWHALQGLIRWLDEGMEELDRKATDTGGFAFTASEWARRSPDKFTEWAEKYRAQWAHSEADEREFAARCLSRAKQLIQHSDSAEELAMAAFDISTLQKRKQEVEERKLGLEKQMRELEERKRGLEQEIEATGQKLKDAQQEIDAMEPIKQKAEKHSEKARAGGKKQPWGWAKPLWLAFAKDWWERNPTHSANQVYAEIVKRHDPTRTDCFLVPPGEIADIDVPARTPTANTVLGVIKALQPTEFRSKSGRKKTDSAGPRI